MRPRSCGLSAVCMQEGGIEAVHKLKAVLYSNQRGKGIVAV